MYPYLQQSLHRQNQALVLLSHLLDEEFQHLGKGDPQSVARVEFSIQELLRQLAVERQELKERIQALDPSLPAMRDLPLLVDESEQDAVKNVLREIDRMEQHCGRKAAQNAAIAQGLIDQNQALLDFLTNEMKPKTGNTYSQYGKWHHTQGTGALLRGRM
jgi:flagellar biosynthesis/type III secretory pathway chaperone